MKRFVIVLSSLLAFFACQETGVTTIIKESESYESNSSFDKFLESLDSLNSKYNAVEVKSPVQDMAVGTVADLIGEKIGQWAGKELGAGVGVVTANPAIGVLGYIIGRQVGGVVGSATLSYVAGKIFLTQSQMNNLVGTPWANSGFMQKIYNGNLTYGSLHNYLINQVRTNGETYLNNDNSIDFENIFNDILEMADSCNYVDSLGHNESYQSTFLSFCEDFIDITVDAKNSNTSVEDYLDSLSDLLIEEGIPTSSVSRFMLLTSSLLSATSGLSDEELASYENDFYSLVSNSEMGAEAKGEVMKTGSIAINSLMFWQ